MTPRTWNGQPSSYWQHNRPLACPKKHPRMGWLGSRFWHCATCRVIYVEVERKRKEDH